MMEKQIDQKEVTLEFPVLTLPLHSLPPILFSEFVSDSHLLLTPPLNLHLRTIPTKTSKEVLVEVLELFSVKWELRVTVL